MDMNTNSQQEHDYFQNGGGQNLSPQPTGRRRTQILVAICIAATIFAGVVLIRAFVQKSTSGLLTVNTDDSVTLSLEQPGTQAHALGTGSQTLRLQAGTYMIRATDGDKQSLKTVTVDKQSDISTDITVSELIKPQVLAEYNAGNLLENAGNLYFLDNTTKIPNVMRQGSVSGQPFVSSVYPATSLYWLSPNSFFALKDKAWQYVKDGAISPLGSGSSVPNDVNSVSFEQGGGYAYITKAGSLIQAASPTSQPRKLATLPDTGYRTALAPDDSLLVYSVASVNKDRQAKLIKDGRQKTLSNNYLQHSRSAVWSPDSLKLALATDSGVDVYTLASDSTTAVYTGLLANPDSLFWLDSTSLVYAQNQVVWKFDLRSGQSTKLTSYSNQLADRNPFYLTTDKQLYYGTSSTDASKIGAINRLALSGQATGNQPSQAGGSLPKPLTFSGFAQLADIGVSTDQLANLTYAMNQFITSKQLTVATVALQDSTIQSAPTDRERNISTVNFTVKLDNTSYGARVDYSSLSTIHLYLYNAQGGLVYDSGDITT